MIIRVQGSGQYRLADAALDGLNRLDNDLQAAVNRHDEQAVTSLLYSMIAYVEKEGSPMDSDEILPSDAILPPGDLTYAEITTTLKQDGLIPG